MALLILTSLYDPKHYAPWRHQLDQPQKREMTHSCWDKRCVGSFKSLIKVFFFLRNSILIQQNSWTEMKPTNWVHDSSINKTNAMTKKSKPKIKIKNTCLLSKNLRDVKYRSNHRPQSFRNQETHEKQWYQDLGSNAEPKVTGVILDKQNYLSLFWLCQTCRKEHNLRNLASNLPRTLTCTRRLAFPLNKSCWKISPALSISLNSFFSL